MTDFATKIGHNIKVLREKNDVSREEIAIKLGVSKAAIQSWEIGARCVPLIALQNLADVLRLDVHEFFKEIYPNEHESITVRH